MVSETEIIGIAIIIPSKVLGWFQIHDDFMNNMSCINISEAVSWWVPLKIGYDEFGISSHGPIYNSRQPGWDLNFLFRNNIFFRSRLGDLGINVIKSSRMCNRKPYEIRGH